MFLVGASRRLFADPSSICYSTLVAKVRELVTFPSELEAKRIISGLKWIGLFSGKEKVVPKGKPVNLLDTLCTRLENLMKYEPGESDLVMLQHKFTVEWKDGSTVSLLLPVDSFELQSLPSPLALFS